MIQLKVYESPQKLTPTFVDLYEDSPIKLTLSVEDITNAEATSVFSKAFRIPNTPTNAKYFKHAFLIEGIDFDVTITKPAEVLVDGTEFRSGNIRLQKIYNNRDLDRIDYEILFLGETKDFSSVIGDASMCDLDIDDLTHIFSAPNVQQSWLAYPESSTLTAGLNNGNVLYPLISHGNTYNENGVVQEGKIGIGSAADGNFNHQANALAIEQFKPMVRVKRLWDAIFEVAGYTYDSDFINPAVPEDSVFSSLYASAFGNEASIGFDPQGSSLNTFSAIGQTTGAICQPLRAEVELSDLGNNYNTSISRYGPAVSAGLYTFTASAYVYGLEKDRSPSGGSSTDTNVSARLELKVNGTTVATSPFGHDQTVSLNASVTLAIGDNVYVEVEPTDQVYCSSSDFSSVVNSQTFACTQAPGNVNPVANFDCEYKQIDFIKDVLTTFRLVMSPDYNKPFNFIIEPFVDYIGSGETHDWSDKLMLDKDLIVEPLFFTQSDRIDFKHTPDGDYINAYHLAAYNETFGYLEFDSNNDLLKGSRSIETKWSPTPMTQIEGTPTTSSFILPQLHVHEAGDAGTLHLPIKPKTRFLFYNGTQLVETNSSRWYLEGASPERQERFPLVSYSSEWPMTQTGTVLNWNVDIGYWGNVVSGFPSRLGQSMYDLYWSGYINSLYNKNARRVTGTFILNSVDLQDFSFDDIIYVNGVYYRPEKIIDAQIGDLSPTKVQLIKLVDNFVTVNPEPEFTTYFAEIYDGCTLVAECYPTSQFSNLTVGTIMIADLVDQASPGGFTACVRVGQVFTGLPPQGAATGTLQDGATYFDCITCGEAIA